MAGPPQRAPSDDNDSDLNRRELFGLPKHSVVKAPSPAPSTTIHTTELKDAYQTALQGGANNLIFFLKMHANSYSNDIGGQFLMKLLYGPDYNLRAPEKHEKGSENYEALLSFFQRFAEQGNRMHFSPYEEKCLNAAYEVAVPETRLQEIGITHNIKALFFNRRQMLLFGGVAALGSLAFAAPSGFEFLREKFNGDLAKKYERIIDGAFEKAKKDGYTHDSERIGKELVETLKKEGPTVGDIASQIGMVMALLVLGSQIAKVISKGYNQYEDKAEYLIKAVHELCEVHLDLTPVPSEFWTRDKTQQVASTDGTLAPPQSPGKNTKP